ncbi:MAG TPA: hypothetical protein V6C58_09080, partial [Allocoleopsis sp.]
AFLPFAHLQNRVEIEIDVEHDYEDDDQWKYYWRKLILAAHKEIMKDVSAEYEEYEEYEDEEPIDHTSDNLFEWECMIHDLVFEIFWDTDWRFLEIDPQLIEGMPEAVGYILGVDEEYFTTKLPKVTTAMAYNACTEIHDLYERFTVVSEFLKNNENQLL